MFNRKLLGIVFAVICGFLGVATVATHTSQVQAATVVVPSPPTNRVIIYSGQNPSSAQTNYAPRYVRLTEGTLMRDLLGGLGATGAYSNLIITAGSGLHVTINPTNASQLGAVYQLGADDTQALPTSVPNIPADPTQIMLMGTQAANTAALGPLTAPGSNSMYYLIEAQLSQVDNTTQSILFINSNGTTQYNNVNTLRSDVITYQTVAGAPAASPTPPPVDSGWISIGNVLITNGQTQVHSGDITMDPTTFFGGLVAGVSPIVVTGPNVSCPTCVTTAGGQSIAGTTTMVNTTVSGNLGVTGGPVHFQASGQSGGGGTCWTGFPSLVVKDITNTENLLAIGDGNTGGNLALNLSLCGDITNVIPPAIGANAWTTHPWIWATDPIRGGPESGVTLTPMAICDTSSAASPNPFVYVGVDGEQISCGLFQLSFGTCGSNTACIGGTVTFAGSPGAFTDNKYNCQITPQGSGQLFVPSYQNKATGSFDIYGWGPSALTSTTPTVSYYCVE